MDCVENGIAGTQTDLGCIPNDPLKFVEKFYVIGLSLIGGVALLFIIYGAYLLLTSQGNKEQIKNGKQYIVYSLISMAMVVFGFVFIQVVAVDILHLPGFN